MMQQVNNTCLVYRFTAIKTAGEPKAKPKLTGPNMLNRSSALERLIVSSNLHAKACEDGMQPGTWLKAV